MLPPGLIVASQTLASFSVRIRSRIHWACSRWPLDQTSTRPGLSSLAISRNSNRCDAPAALRLACQASRYLARYARTFPLGRPAAHLCQGQVKWRSGKRHSARREWRRSLATAAQMGMPYAEALAHCEFGRELDAGDEERTDHLSHAAEIFARLNAAHDLAAVEGLMGSRT